MKTCKLVKRETWESGKPGNMNMDRWKNENMETQKHGNIEIQKR